jgi:hypothetical protein
VYTIVLLLQPHAITSASEFQHVIRNTTQHATNQSGGCHKHTSAHNQPQSQASHATKQPNQLCLDQPEHNYPHRKPSTLNPRACIQTEGLYTTMTDSLNPRRPSHPRAKALKPPVQAHKQLLNTSCNLRNTRHTTTPCRRKVRAHVVMVHHKHPAKLQRRTTPPHTPSIWACTCWATEPRKRVPGVWTPTTSR